MSYENLRQASRTELDKLTAVDDTTRAKQESTLLAIVRSELMTGGYDRPEFWKRRDTCAKSTWSRWNRKYPELTAVLTELSQVVREWGSDEAVTAVSEAKEVLQLASLEAAQTLVDISRHSDDTNRRHASNSLLDRADAATAPQGQSAIAPQDMNTLLEKIYGEADPDDESGTNGDE